MSAPSPSLEPPVLPHVAHVAQVAQVARLATLEPLDLPELSERLRHEHLVWDAFVGGRRRVDLHPLVLSPTAHEDAIEAAIGAYSAVGLASRHALSLDEEAAKYRFSPELRALARASHLAGDVACLARVDLLLGADGRFRACEINADCPGGLNEAHGLPDLLKLAGYKGRIEPRSVVDALAARLVAASGGKGSPLGLIALVFATAYAEDLQICALVERAVVRAGGRALRAPPTALSIEDGRCALHGQPVSVLYRYYPSEHFAELPIAQELASVIESGRLMTLSSFASMFAQSKLAFARVHALVSTATWPPDLARAVADRIPLSVPPSEAPRLVEDREAWVLKRALGRVGDEVFVGELETPDDWAKLVDGVLRSSSERPESEERGPVREAEHRAVPEPWIAQRFVRQSTVPTPWGPRYVTLGAYLLDGQFVGYFARLTSVSHTSHDALVVPVVVAESATSVGADARVDAAGLAPYGAP